MIHDLARSYTSLGRAILRFPHAPWDDALSHGQMQSKAWATAQMAKLKRDFGLVYVVGGWLGMLPLLMFETSLRFRKIRSFDIDPTCEPIADQVNIEHAITDWRFKAITMDMFKIDYGDNFHYEIPVPGRPAAQMTETCNTIINTSCDHIANFPRWWAMIPKGKIVLLQNNDFKAADADHVNTVSSVDDVVAQAPMSKVMFKGTLKLAKYNRFMVLGIK